MQLCKSVVGRLNMNHLRVKALLKLFEGCQLIQIEPRCVYSVYKHARQVD